MRSPFQLRIFITYPLYETVYFYKNQIILLVFYLGYWKFQ